MQRCCRRLAAAAAHVTCRGKKLASAIWPIKLSIGLLCANCVAVPHSGFAGRLVLRTNSSDVKAAGGPPAGAAAAAARVADDCQQRQQQPQAHTDQCPPAAKAQPCPRPQPCAQCPRLPDPPPRAQQPRRKRMPVARQGRGTPVVAAVLRIRTSSALAQGSSKHHPEKEPRSLATRPRPAMASGSLTTTRSASPMPR